MTIYDILKHKLINITFKVKLQDMNNLDELVQAATQARSQAYAPYSQFKVGAAIKSDNNQIYIGCNVENISFPCGTCAEAGAIANMIAHGGKKIIEIVIVADGKDLIAPCGNCLQKIQEFAISTTKIHLADLHGIKKTLSINELLPYAFSDEELKK